METSDQNTINQAYFTDSNSSNVALTLEQGDYDPAKFPHDPRDEPAIASLATADENNRIGK
jgi:hypothetical protein